MNALLLTLLLAGSALSVPLRQSPESLCLDAENFARIPAEDSCIKYFQCYSGNAYLMQCPDLTWFNDGLQVCDESDPPEGCEVEGPPAPPPLEPQEPEEQPEEPETDTEDPETLPEVEPEDEILEPEEDNQEPEEGNQEPEEENQEPGEEIGTPEIDTEDPETEPQAPENEETNETEDNPEETESGETEPGQEVEEPEVDTQEPETDVPDEDSENSQEPDAPIEELEPPIEEIVPSEIEGSGDPSIEEEEGSGFALEDLKRYLAAKVGRIETAPSMPEIFFSSSESSGDLPVDDFDYELNHLFIPLMRNDDVAAEKPTIDPTFILPDPDAKY